MIHELRQNNYSLDTQKIRQLKEKNFYLIIQGGGIMYRPEQLKQTRSYTLYENLNTNNLRVIRCDDRTNILVRRVICDLLRTPDFGLSHSCLLEPSASGKLIRSSKKNHHRIEQTGFSFGVLL